MKLRAFVLLLFASAAFAHDVALTWSPGTCPTGQTCSAATGFNVKRSATKGGPYTTIQSLPVTTTTYDDASTTVQAEGQHFYYVVTATSPGGESANSNEFDALIPFSLPANPKSLSGVVH